MGGGFAGGGWDYGEELWGVGEGWCWEGMWAIDESSFGELSNPCSEAMDVPREHGSRLHGLASRIAWDLGVDGDADETV